MSLLSTTRRTFLGLAGVALSIHATGARPPSHARSVARPRRGSLRAATANSFERRSAHVRRGSVAAHRRAARTCSTRSSPACRSSNWTPTDDSVGYGGLPNADGVVQLDASVMQVRGGCRRSRRSRACGTPAAVALAVATSTDHHLLVGTWRAEIRPPDGVHDRGGSQHAELPEEMARMEAAHRSRSLARSGPQARAAAERATSSWSQTVPSRPTSSGARSIVTRSARNRE